MTLYPLDWAIIFIYKINFNTKPKQTHAMLFWRFCHLNNEKKNKFCYWVSSDTHTTQEEETKQIYEPRGPLSGLPNNKKKVNERLRNCVYFCGDIFSSGFVLFLLKCHENKRSKKLGLCLLLQGIIPFKDFNAYLIIFYCQETYFYAICIWEVLSADSGGLLLLNFMEVFVYFRNLRVLF